MANNPDKIAFQNLVGQAPNEDKVIIGYVHPGMVHGEFMRSLLNMLVYDAVRSRRLFDGGGIIEYQAGANLSGPRNGLVKMFRQHKAAWLLMVDSDMQFPPDAVDRMLEKADPEKAPIVGGLCFGLIDDGRVLPTLFDIFEGPDGKPEVGRYHEWDPDTLMKVAGTGTGFLLIHRSVFDKFDAFEPTDTTTAFNKTYPYFQESEYSGKPIGEDLTFCFRANLLHIPVHVDTSVYIGHVKTRVLDIDSYLTEYKRTKEPTNA